MNMQEAIATAAEEIGLSLKPKQLEAIQKFCSGKDVFVSLPTGYGKSIIYAILPRIFDKLRGKEGSLLVCISPLTAIMINQKAKFNSYGLTAEFVGEAQTDVGASQRVIKGEVQLIFISPENIICNRKYRQMLMSPVYKENLIGIAVDEAHCVKTWGDEFRVAFASLGELRSIVPSNVNIVALTATATCATLDAVTERLAIRNPEIVGSSPDRPNIFLSVSDYIPLPTVVEKICINLKKEAKLYSKTVIFCHSYQDCSDLYSAMSNYLGKHMTDPPGYPNLPQYRLVTMYTRASTAAMKETVMSLFTQGDSVLRVVIATMAFSMGIDCPNIRQVIHWGAPADLEQYLQEIGRAGRDGLDSNALLICSKRNRHVKYPMINYYQNKEHCRRQMLFRSFLLYEHSNATKCKCCDICCRSCDCNNCKK